jgi:hypothetical protein
MSRRAQILSCRKRERERLGMNAVGGGGGQIGRKKERKIRKKDKKERKIRADKNNLGKGRYREEKTETKRKKGLDTCKARVAPTCLYNKSPCPTKNEPPPQQQVISYQ